MRIFLAVKPIGRRPTNLVDGLRYRVTSATPADGAAAGFISIAVVAAAVIAASPISDISHAILFVIELASFGGIASSRLPRAVSFTLRRLIQIHASMYIVLGTARHKQTMAL